MATSYANTGGTGDRTSIITITSTANAGDPAIALIDGSFSDTYWWISNQTERVVDLDFGSHKVIDEFKWYQSTSHSQGAWVFEASNDRARWTRLAGPFTLGGAETATYPFTNTGGYRYYRLRQIDGQTRIEADLREIEFKIDDGSAAFFAPTTPDYDNIGGRGPREDIIAVTATVEAADGIENLVDGAFNAIAFTAGTPFGSNLADREIKFDFGAGATKVITEFKWYQNTTHTHGTWKLQGSNDDAAWTDIGDSFTLGGATEATYTEPSGNTSGYRYYRLLQIAGETSAVPYNLEIEFKIADGEAVVPPVEPPVVPSSPVVRSIRAVFFRLDTDPPLRLWCGINDIPIGIETTDADGSVYLGAGRLLNVPDLEVLINGVADRVEFFLPGVSLENSNRVAVDAPEIQGLAVHVGVATLDDRYQPLTHITPVWYGLADLWAMNQPKSADPESPPTRTLVLSVGSGRTGRARARRASYTSAQQKLAHPTDKFCDLTPRYTTVYQVKWP